MTSPPRSYFADWPIVVCILATAALVAIFGHVLMRVPIAFGDQFQEIATVYSQALRVTLKQYWLNSDVFFRPMEYVWRYVIAYGVNDGVFGYNRFQLIVLAVTAMGLAFVCHPRNGRDIAAFLIALAVLFGHHGTQGTFELNITFSNGLVMAFSVVAIAVVKSTGGFWWQVTAVAITVVAILTKEVGLVLAGVLVLAHMLGMPGVRRMTAILIVLIASAYVLVRLGSLPDLAAVGGDSHKASDIAGYLSNIVAGLVMFWIAAPHDGEWSQLWRFADQPWYWIQIVAGLATAALLIAGHRLAREPVSCDAGVADFDRRWLLLFGAALVGSSVLGFYYVRDRHGATAVPLLAYCSYLSVRTVLWRLDIASARSKHVSPLLAWATVAALTCALVWPLRVAGGFEFARSLAGNINADWHAAMPRYWKGEGARRPFLVPFARSVDAVPWPVKGVTVLQLLGNRESVSR